MSCLCKCQEFDPERGPFYEVKTEDEHIGSGDKYTVFPGKHTLCRGDVELLQFLADHPYQFVSVRKTDKSPWVTHYVEERAIQVAVSYPETGEMRINE